MLPIEQDPTVRRHINEGMIDVPAEPVGCAVCLTTHRELLAAYPAQENHVPALLAALRDVVLARHVLRAEESVPRELWRALNRAEDVLQDVDPCPF